MAFSLTKIVAVLCLGLFSALEPGRELIYYSTFPPECVLTVGQGVAQRSPLVFDTAGRLWPTTKSHTKPDIWLMRIEDGEKGILSCGSDYLDGYAAENVSNVRFECRRGKLAIDDEGAPSKAWSDLHCNSSAPVKPVFHVFDVTDEYEVISHFKYGYYNPVANKTVVVAEVRLPYGKTYIESVHTKSTPNRVNPPTTWQSMVHTLFKYVRFSLVAPRILANLGKQSPVPVRRAFYLMDYASSTSEYPTILARVEKMVAGHDNGQLAAVRLTWLWNFALLEGDSEVWARLQEQLNGLADKQQKVLEHWTGTHGVLTRKEQTLYVDQGGNSYPLPKYLWAIVRDEERAWAFIYFNGHYVNEYSTRIFNKVCPTKCDQVEWLDRTGLGERILCCDVKDARANIPEIPADTRSNPYFFDG